MKRNKNYLPIERLFIAICANSGMNYKDFCEFFENNQINKNKILIPESSYNMWKNQYKNSFFPELSETTCSNILNCIRNPPRLSDLK